MKLGETIFVDSGAWVALAVESDPWHALASEQWVTIERSSARLVTSVPVFIETFTFLDRRGSRRDALLWRESLQKIRALRVVGCTAAHLASAGKELERPIARRVSLVDATSFAIMRTEGIRRAFTFDQHFATAGFLPVA